MSALQQVDQYVGKYYSLDWVRRNVLRQTDEEIEDIKKQIEQEADEMAQLEGSVEDPDSANPAAGQPNQSGPQQ